MEEIYTEVITEHSRCQENKHPLPCATCCHKGHNPSCGDEITLELKVEDGIVKDAAFTGAGCAISQASTDIMIDLMRGKTVEEASQVKLDAVTGATYSSKAIIENINRGLASLKK